MKVKIKTEGIKNNTEMVNISSDTSIDSSDNDISEEEYNKQETKREQIIAQHQQQTTSHKRNHNLPTPPATKGSKKNSDYIKTLR